MLTQEGLPVLDADLDVVDSFDIGVIGVDAGIGEGAVLGDGRGLQVGRSQIGERIGAGIVVVDVLAGEGAQVEDRVCC